MNTGLTTIQGTQKHHEKNISACVILDDNIHSGVIQRPVWGAELPPPDIGFISVYSLFKTDVSNRLEGPFFTSKVDFPSINIKHTKHMTRLKTIKWYILSNMLEQFLQYCEGNLSITSNWCSLSQIYQCISAERLNRLCSNVLSVWAELSRI